MLLWPNHVILDRFTVLAVYERRTRLQDSVSFRKIWVPYTQADESVVSGDPTVFVVRPGDVMIQFGVRRYVIGVSTDGIIFGS